MQKHRLNLHRIPKWVYLLLTILIILSLGITFLVKSRLEPFVSEKIKTAVSEVTDGLYTTDFTGIHISVVRGNISFDSLSLKPDTAIFRALREKNEAPRHLYQLNIKGLAFRNISLWDIWRHKKFDMSSLVIYKPEIIATFNDYQSKEKQEDKRTAYQQISKFLKSFHIGSVIFNDADFRYIDKSGEAPQTTTIKGLNIHVTELLVDSASQYDKSRFYYTKNIQLNLKDHKFITKDGLYDISIADVSSSTASKILRISNFRVKPRYPEMEFSRKYKVQHDRYDLNFKEILLNNVDFLKFNTQRKLQASVLLVNGADVKIFMNRELPPVSFDKGRNYPHVAIRRLKLNTSIDSVLIKDSRINYSEYNPKSKKKGTVTFDRFNALIRNVSNDPDQLAADHWARANVRAWLMNKGRMDVNLNMDLTAKNADFNFNGTMARMDMRELNALSRNMSLAEIRSGMINKAEFRVSANWRTSSGYLKLNYNDLSIDLLKNDTDTDTLKKRGLLSALANSLIIINDNPGKDGRLRTGKAEAVRINSASFFNLMWKSVFAGLKESVGFTLESTKAPKPAAKKKK